MTSGIFEIVPISKVWIDRAERQRKDFSVEDLLQSIPSVGLINPIVIQRDGKLIAGERRYTACSQLGWTDIPIQYADTLDPVTLHLIELEENVKRKNLSWQDEIDAVAKFHQLKASQDPAWNMESTAEALGMSRSSTSDKLAVAKALESGMARVTEAPKFSVAVGIVKRDNARKKVDAVQRLAATEVEEGPEDRATSESGAVPLAAPAVPLLNASFHDWALEYTGPKFNLLHCDFPYGVNADKHDQGQAALQGGYEDSPDVYWNLIDTLRLVTERHVEDSAHLIFWFSMDYYKETLDALTSIGWKTSPFPLVWHKSDNTGVLPDPNRGPRRTYETAFFASRGDRLIVGAKANSFSHPGRDKSIHMSEKPKPMLRHFLSMVCDEHSTMLDPTCGSGNAVKVAQLLGAERVLGLELNAEFHERAVAAWTSDVDL